MSRTAVYQALILRSRPSGESNREVFLLTAEEGIIRATVFGGPKSKLRAHAAPFNSGQVWVYLNPVKDSAKLSDFDVHSWRPGLRELYDRTMAAGAIADTILATHGGGGAWDTALKLALTALDALETASEQLCPQLLVHFLWQWAGFLGMQPHIECCAVCGKEAADSPLWFDASEGSVFCAACASSVPQSQALSPKSSSVPGLLQLNPGCRRWLSAVGGLEFMDNKSFYEAKALATAVMAGALGKRLASWDW
ncbi:MAG: DNA repair protein RecO C-terminal domain-containing protein [Treponema sp.]|jgi:DNA repair protein RecO (recombination protein O)|nr:DNA repair protein RecO C-terminal domain-containing protein [Treponema sp.]